jgi:hypothetical protein
MVKWGWLTGSVAAFLLVTCVEGAAAGAVTFNKDVLPILQRNCQSCHRPGNIAPMSLLTYESARPWAKAMKAAVVSRKMPPWFADPQYGHFSNDRSLTQEDIDTIVQWVDGGAVQGDPKDAPPAIQWPDNGWTTQPDIVLKGMPYTVPAAPPRNVIEWMTLVTPTGFTKDMWITSVEIKPSELGVTHHICVSFVPHRPGTVYNTLLWVDKQRDETGAEVPPSARKILAPTADGKGRELAAGAERVSPNTGTNLNSEQNISCYVPGRSLSDFRPYKAALLVPAGFDLMWNIHYTPNGVEVTDRPEVGLTVAKEPPQRWLIESGNNTNPAKLVIPPNSSNYAPEPAEFTFLEDAELHWMSPHMHVRGKDMTYKLVLPDGTERVVLNVPRYDFNWQLGYDLAEPIKIPKGAKLIVTAHYDNSANNKFNPDPNKTVYFGNMTWEEMFSPFFSITVDKSVDPKKAVKPPIGGVGNGA